MRYETVWEFRTSHFLVTLDVAPEEMDPADSFDCQDDIDAVRNGDVEWFCARVAVHLLDVQGERGNIVGADYLGGCAYKSFDDFRESHFRDPVKSRNTLANKASRTVYCHYFPSMVAEAVTNARQMLAKLKAIPLRA